MAIMDNGEFDGFDRCILIMDNGGEFHGEFMIVNLRIVIVIQHFMLSHKQ